MEYTDAEKARLVIIGVRALEVKLFQQKQAARNRELARVVFANLHDAYKMYDAVHNVLNADYAHTVDDEAIKQYLARK